MDLPDDPTVVRTGSTDPDAPLVVLLHGRGSDERDIVRLAEHLPAGPSFVAVRGPLPAGEGFTWFESLAPGRPEPSSLEATRSWLATWLAAVAPEPRPVCLVGFSAGAMLAGALVLAEPERVGAVALLYGVLPLDAVRLPHDGALSGISVLVAQGEHDEVIPSELKEETRTYLVSRSGAHVIESSSNGGHAVAPSALRALEALVRSWSSPKG